MQWFRFYSESLNDPKIQTLPAEVFKVWVNTLCLACNNDSKDGNIGTINDVSFALRETISTVSSAFHTLTALGLIETVCETFHIKSWRKRQYKSDVSTERVKRFRKRYETVSETPPDTDTEQKEKDTKKKITLDELSVSHISDWLQEKRRQGKYRDVDENFAVEYFKDWARSKNAKRLDWIASLRNSFTWEVHSKAVPIKQKRSNVVVL